MKKSLQNGLRSFYSLILCLVVGISAYGQKDICVELLRDGLRDTYNTVDNASLFTDSKRYFSSDEFKNDYHEGKWNGDISLSDGLESIGLSAGSSDTDLEEFQKQVRESSSITVNKKTFSTVSRSILNIDLANAFNDCVVLNEGYGLSIEVEGETTANVTVRYKTLASGDVRPTITSAELLGVVESRRVEILKSDLAPGKQLVDQFSFSAPRITGAEMIIIVNTSNGLSIAKRLEGDDTQTGGVPIGSIVASVLDFETFSKVTRSNPSATGVWSPVKSKWAPCDGRAVVGSKYQVLWAGAIGSHAPDLRGIFMRGLNQFDSKEPVAVDAAQKNPDEQKGKLQVDEVGPHTHPVKETNRAVVAGGYHNYGDGDKQGQDYGVGLVVLPNDGVETRPKNISVYYYIRIN